MSSSSGGGGEGGSGASKDFYGLPTGGGGCSCGVPERGALDPKLAAIAALTLATALRNRSSRSARRAETLRRRAARKGGAR
jgi:hypothetical protein